MTPVAGYTSHEPHGYLTGDYPNGGVVTGDRAGLQRLATRPVRFSLVAYTVGAGKPDAGVCVVLCCKAVVPPRDGSPPEGRPVGGQMSGHTADRSQPDAVAGGMRRGRRRDRSYRP